MFLSKDKIKICYTSIICFDIMVKIKYSSILFLSLRYHKDSLKNLKNQMGESMKIQRHRRNLFNIHITVVSWIVEFFGFLFIAFGSFVIGRNEPIVATFVDPIINSLYFIVLPTILLVTDTEHNVTESKWYLTILRVFNMDYTSPVIEQNTNEQGNYETGETNKKRTGQVENNEIRGNQNEETSNEVNEQYSCSNKDMNKIGKIADTARVQKISALNDCEIIDLE